MSTLDAKFVHIQYTNPFFVDVDTHATHLHCVVAVQVPVYLNAYKFERKF